MDRAEEFVAPWARDMMQAVKQALERHGDKFYMLRASAELGSPPGGASPDRAAAVVACDYWCLLSEQTRKEKGAAAVGVLWEDSRMEYRLVRWQGAWRVEDPLGKGHGALLMQEVQSWPPLQPWPPK